MDSVARKSRARVRVAAKKAVTNRKRIKKNLFKNIFSSKLVLGLTLAMICFFAVAGVLGFVNSQGRVKGEMDVNEPKKIVPEIYTNPVVASWGLKTLSIQPMAGEKVRVRKEDVRYIYEGAYKNTDVIQTVYPYKIKEEFVFSAPGHPTVFKYKLGNWESYIIKEDDEGNIIFYDRQNYEETKELARIFTIPTPYIEDKVGSRSFKAVTTIINNENLTISVDQNWLKTAKYPVVLDPTIEINVINIQSYPVVGGEWKIEFTTQGREGLTITGMSHDEYKTIFDEDVEFKSLRCGQAEIQTLKQGNSYLAGTWECADKGILTVKVLKPGKHHLQFDLGGEKADAYNSTWLSGWDYRKSHTITGSAGAGTNYQVKITVYYGSGSDSGGSVYLDSKGETDFGDIRFTDNDGSTELDYWMESKTDSDNAVFWVEVADTLESNAVIYIYYGKTGETTTSNGADTFLFFDDFSGDLSKWSRDKTSGVYPEIPSGQEYVRCGGGSTSPPYGHTSLGSSPTYTGFNNNALIYRARVSTNGIGEVAFRGSYAGNTGYKDRFDERSGQGNSFLKPPYSGWGFLGSCGADGDRPAVDTWYAYEITASGSTFKMYRDGVLKKTCSDVSYASAGEIALQNHYGSYTDYDWAGVRKFVATEPAHSTWGEEETAPAPAANQNKAELKSGTIKIQSGTIKINFLDKFKKIGYLNFKVQSLNFNLILKLLS